MLKRNLDDAARFLGALSREPDGYRVPTVFQTYDDHPAKRPWLARVLIGSLTEMADTLLRLEALGACICTTVQETTFKGRRTEDVVGLRAAFTDADGPMVAPPLLPPSMVVESHAGNHTYWLLPSGEPLELFSRVQRRLASHYRTDPAVHDLPRVMRVPGFLHQKGKPFLVRLRICEPARAYHLRELLEAHGGLIDAPRKGQPKGLSPMAADAASFAAWVEKKPIAPGSRNRTAYAIAAEGLARGLSLDHVEGVVVKYCERAGIPDEAVGVFRSAVRHNERSPFVPTFRHRRV